MNTSENPTQKKRPAVIALKIPDKQALYMSYMPYLKRRGMFISRNNSKIKMGDEVFLVLDIWCEPEKFNIAGKVVWVTPDNAQNGKKSGFGVHFNKTESQQISSIIERILGNKMNSKYATLTM